MTNKASLKLTFDSGHGEIYTMVVPLEENVASDIEHISPSLFDQDPFVAGRGSAMEQAVNVLRRKQFRKDLFVQQANNLGALLAERMEDAEGWHDSSRIEPAKKELKQ